MDKLIQGVRPYLALSLLCLILYLPGLASLPPMDRDESRFVQATRQMLDSGDYVRIQFQDEMRAKKPVGAYWLQALSVNSFSHPKSTQMWPYRLPSALAAWAAVLMTFAFGRSLVGARPALLAAGLLASTVILASEAHQAKTDAILLACVVAAQGVLARFYVAGRTREMTAGSGGSCSSGGGGCGSAAKTETGPSVFEALLFWTAQGVGILVKGPIVPIISLLTIATLGVADRNARWFLSMKPLLGTLVAVALAAPWFVLVSQATGGEFLGAAVKHDLLPKLLGAQESHGGFPGLYLVALSLSFWPGSLLVWPALAKAWGQRRRLVFRFLLAWLVPAWVMFEIVPTKLPHYVLPLFPALALLVAALAWEGLEAYRSRAAKVWYALWVVIGLGLAGAVLILPIHWGQGFDFGNIPAAIGIVLATLLPAWLALKGRVATAGLTLMLTAAATYPAVFQGTLPKLDRMFVSRSVAQVVDSLALSGPIATAGYSEPSLVFLLGTDTKLTDGAGAARHLAGNRHGAALVSERDEAAFLAAAAQAGITPVALARIEGFNYSRGKPIVLGIWGQKAR